MPVESNSLTTAETMERVEAVLSHVWMVRTFIKHSDEAAEDDELREVQRVLYDFMLALGTAWKAKDAEAYLRQARKKIGKLRDATQLFVDIQPDVSSHTNFQMAATSLKLAVNEATQLLATTPPISPLKKSTIPI